VHIVITGQSTESRTTEIPGDGTFDCRKPVPPAHYNFPIENDNDRSFSISVEIKHI